MKRVFFSILVICVAWLPVRAADDVAARLLAHEKYLADDAQEGRGIGTKGLDRSADYIAQQMKDIGLATAFNGSYFQNFTMGWGVHLRANNFVTFDSTKLDTSTGIMPLGFSSPGTVTGTVVFAGYGIIAPEYKYDDFANLETQGAIVVCLTGEPGEFDSTSKFEGLRYTAHSGMRNKAGNAKLKGAVGILYVEGPIYAGKDEEHLVAPRSDEPYIDCGIPALRITRAALHKLFPEFKLEQLQRSIDSNTEPRSLPIADDQGKPFTITVSTDLTRETVPVKNVGGVIAGDPKSVIVLGAHYDHLGYGQSGSLEEKPGLIHNGADDNASGVASILETARNLNDKKPQSTIFVAAFTAEETGLGGSSYLVKNFPLGMENVRCMINLDMVGRMKDNKLSVQSCKTAVEFDSIVTAANKMSANFEISCKGDGYGPSDHMNFFLADKPVLFLFTGAHEDYHKSTDDWDKINYPDMARVVMFTTTLVNHLDTPGKPLTFVKATEPPPDQGGRFRVTFGTIPDYAQADSLIGVLLSGVRPDGPAEKAGIKGGDLLTKMGDVKLNNIYDFVFALRRYAPGDSVEVRYVREGKELVTHAVLKAPSH
jgi:hypothetical protein